MELVRSMSDEEIEAFVALADRALRFGITEMRLVEGGPATT
jgi:hypothetical protein